MRTSIPSPLPSRCPPRLARASRGLTLVELMLGVTVLVIVLALAAPSFSQWGRNTRVSTQAAELQNALAYAQSEAMRRGVRVTLCRSANPNAASPGCASSGSWATGWMVFVDNTQTPGNVAGVLDGADAVLRVGDPAQGSAITTAGNLGGWISFSPSGLVYTATATSRADGSFLVCQAPHGRRLSLGPTGVVTSATESCS